MIIGCFSKKAICNPNATGGGYNWDGPGPYFPIALQLGNATASGAAGWYL